MKAYVLNVPKQYEAKVKEFVEKSGFMSMPNASGEGMVVLCDTLPKVLERFLPGAVQQTSEGAVADSKKSVVAKKNQVFALDVPFEFRSVAGKVGAKWDGTYKGWFYEGTELPDILKTLQAARFSWEDAIARAKMGIEPKGFKGSDPYTLKAHQIEAQNIIAQSAKAKMPGFLLADEVGLGKTLSAWGGVQQVCEILDIKTILIVCPLSVQAHWRLTIERQGSVIGQIVIMNYERLNKLFELESGVKVKSKKGLARRATAAQVDLIIFDESHKLKNPTSARSKFARKLVDNAKFVLWLSATAGQTPLELSYLAPILSKSTGSRARDLNDFEAWCQSMGFKLKRGSFGAWVWDGDKEDCDRLAQMLFKSKPTIGLRRRPQDIAGWPEISRILMPVELEPNERQLYEKQWDIFKAYLRTQKAQLLQMKGAAKKGKVNGLVEALRFRQKSSLLRVQATFDFAMDLLEEGIKPAISCAFKETLEQLKKKFEAQKIAVSVIDGSQNADAREQERLRFQKGQSKVVLFTIEEGISLHQGEYEDVPRSLLIHDLRWSAIQMAQIEGRTHRNGVFSQAYWLLASGTVEHKVALRVAQRAVSMKALSGEVDEGLERDIIEELLKESEQ